MMDNLLAALSIEGWCNDHTWAILSRVLPEGATICGAPGRWDPSKKSGSQHQETTTSLHQPQEYCTAFVHFHHLLVPH